MKALEFSRLGVVELVDAPEPQPGPDDVLVSVAAAGICGSDVHGINGGFLREPPLIMGHEFAGMAEGRRVAVNPMLSCGHCAMCAGGNDQLCVDRSIIGIHRAGGFAERVSVPRSALVELPERLSFEAAAMIEPLAVALHAWRLAQALPDSRVAVIGAGTIGLMALSVARLDVADIVAVDVSEDRLTIAQRLGATVTATRLDGEFDVIIDAVGAAATHAASVARLAPRGTAIWIGNLSPEPAFDAKSLVRGEHRVLGSFAYSQRDFAAAARLAPKLPLDWFTTYPMAEAVDVFAALASGRPTAVKAQLRP